MQRTSTDGKQTALLIYNFHNTPENVTVDLTGTGINTQQVPKDLYNGGRGPRHRSAGGPAAMVITAVTPSLKWASRAGSPGVSWALLCGLGLKCQA